MPSRFRFHGQAIGAAGRISSPFHEVIEVQAASALPEIGGHGSANSANFGYREILHFDRAYTQVAAAVKEDNPDEAVHSSVIRATVEGLDILGVVRADRMVASLSCEHSGEPDGEPSFKLIGTHFENLRIAGVPVNVDLAVDVFDRHHSHKLLSDAYRNDEKVRAQFGSPELSRSLKDAPEKVQRCFQPPPKKGSEMRASTGGFTHLSLARSVEPEQPHLPCWGHVIHVDGFGTIRLAELGISKHSRRLTMIHVDLGCPVKGRVMMAMIEGGGDGD